MDYGKAGLRQYLSSLIFIGIIGVFFILNLLITPPEVLVSERRKPAKFPELTVDTVLSGDFMGKFEGYAADRFIFRDSFRLIRSFTVFDVFFQTDKSGLYRDNKVGVGEFKRMDANAFAQTAEKIRKVAESPQLSGLNVYYTFVPDKSTFAGRYLPGFDPEAAEKVLEGVLGGSSYISLTDSGTISATSFYSTDLHWNQTDISDAVMFLCSAMGANADLSEYTKVTAGNFKGVYPGQLALPVAPDSLAYMTLPTLQASYLNENTFDYESGSVYDLERFLGIDPYDIFMRGPQALITLENEAITNGRELYLFRDSFGSSLAPLLAGAYSKITLIDLRYINWQLIDQFIEFTPGADVLFIYSSQIFGNPSILQV